MPGRAAAGGMGDATRARHSAPITGGAARQVGGGESPEPWTPPAPRPPPSGEFFLALRISRGRPKDRDQCRAQGRQPSGWGLCQARCGGDRLAWAWKRQRRQGGWRVCDLAKGPPCRPIIFPLWPLLSGTNELQGNNGNMGTSISKQAECLALAGCRSVPAHLRPGGNMGTECASPQPQKSARVWRPPAPASQ